MTKFQRGKQSYESAMAVCRCPYAPFEQLSKKDQNYWSQKEPKTSLDNRKEKQEEKEHNQILADISWGIHPHL